MINILIRRSEALKLSIRTHITRSDSSSDISVLSNPSECSIEVITNTQKQELQIDNLLVPAPPVTKTSAVSPLLTLGKSARSGRHKELFCLIITLCQPKSMTSD